jgi:predicted exporter
MPARRRRGGASRLCLGLAVALAAAGAEAADLPRTEEELVRQVRAALVAGDMAAFEELINWEGARGVKRRIVAFQVRHGFGRTIRSVALEPFPADALRDVEARGTLKANMPVTHRLRVVFDEPPAAGAAEAGAPPTDLFLVGKAADGAFRIALVVRDERAADDD